MVAKNGLLTAETPKEELSTWRPVAPTEGSLVGEKKEVTDGQTNDKRGEAASTEVLVTVEITASICL